MEGILTYIGTLHLQISYIITLILYKYVHLLLTTKKRPSYLALWLLCVPCCCSNKSSPKYILLYCSCKYSIWFEVDYSYLKVILGVAMIEPSMEKEFVEELPRPPAYFKTIHSSTAPPAIPSNAKQLVQQIYGHSCSTAGLPAYQENDTLEDIMNQDPKSVLKR